MQDAAAEWDRHAPTYARLFGTLTGYIGRSMVHMVDARLPAHARILDIACGAGAVTIPALMRAQRLHAHKGETSLVVGADFSKAMVAHTERAAEGLGAPRELWRCEVQNGEALTYEDASFDAVFSCFGIFLFGDRRAGWREAARVLKPGGLFVTSVWQGPSDNQMLRAQMGPMVQALPPRLQPQPGAAGGWLEVATEVLLLDELRSTAPFEDLHCYPFRACIAIPSARDAWEALADNPVAGALIRQCTEAERAQVERGVLTHLEELAGGPDRALVLESVCNIVVAKRA